jgi:hypothetical protein
LAIITALGAGCAVSPSTSTPDSVTAPSPKATPTPPAKTEVFSYVPYFGKPMKSAELKVIKEWQGTKSTYITYKPEETPWIINAYYIPTSQIQSSLDISLVPTKAIGKSPEGVRVVRIMDVTLITDIGNKIGENAYGLLATTDEETEIKVEASGCKWVIKIGVE